MARHSGTQVKISSVNSCYFPSNQVGDLVAHQVDPTVQLAPHVAGQTTIQSFQVQEELCRQATMQLQQLQKLGALAQDTSDFLFRK